MPMIEAVCPRCGVTFSAWSYANRAPRRYCSQQCWLKVHNSPERNAIVARSSAEQQRLTKIAANPTHGYRKFHGRHEHRVVMERFIGRKLRSDEIVHHRDGNMSNNDFANLILTTRADHARHHFHGTPLGEEGGDAK